MTKSRKRNSPSRRRRLSVRVSYESWKWLKEQVTSGRTTTLGAAIDLAVQELAVTQYYNSLTAEDVAEQRAWGEFAGMALLMNKPDD